jgi:cell wall-associated NlpC family hydrolase
MVNGSDIISYANNFIGDPYVFGGSSPRGFNCSGLVQYVYKHFGINISRTTKTQINEGIEVGRNQLQLGDLVFPSSGHVTLYVGNGQILHAPQPGECVKISNIWSFWRARRILNNSNPPVSSPVPRPVSIPVGNFILQTGTCLHKT